MPGIAATTSIARPLMRGVDVLVGGPASVEAYRAAITSSTGPLAADVYLFSRGAIADALRGATAVQGRDVTLLANHSLATGTMAAALHETGARVVAYGAGHVAADGTPLVLHGKALATPDTGLLTTAAMTDVSASKLDLSFRLRDPADIAALREVLESGASGDAARIARAADAAAGHGILVNDPIGGVRHIDDAISSLIDGAQTRLSVVSKELDDAGRARQLVAARARGVDVRVLVRDVTDRDATILRDGGVTLERMPFAQLGRIDEVLRHRLHMTSVFADDARGYVGSRFFWDPSKAGLSPARELGVLVDGALGRETERGVDSLVRAPRREVLGSFAKWGARMATHPSEARAYLGQVHALLGERGLFQAH